MESPPWAPGAGGGRRGCRRHRPVAARPYVSQRDRSKRLGSEKAAPLSPSSACPPRFLKAVLLGALALGETVAPLRSAGSVKAGGATQCRGGKWGGGPKMGSDSFLISLPKVINRASPARLRSQDLGGLCLSLVKEKHFQEPGIHGRPRDLP